MLKTACSEVMGHNTRDYFLTVLTALLILHVGHTTLFAQESVIGWHSFSSGIVSNNDNHTQILSVLNQSTVASTEGGGSVIESGFVPGVIVYDARFQPTPIEESSIIELPSATVLDQNYPNPFNPKTEIRFSIPHNASVTLTVYNSLGQKIITLLSGQILAGKHSVEWNGKDERGKVVSSGTYLYHLVASDQQGKNIITATKSMVFLK